MEIEMSYGHRGGIQMIAGLLMPLCIWCVCVCVVHAHTMYTYSTCTDIHMCTHPPGNEMVCLLCVTQVWQAMKHLSAFNILLDFLFFWSKAMHLSLFASLHPLSYQIIRLTESHVKCQTPSLLLCRSWGPRLNMSTAGCPSKVSHGCLKLNYCAEWAAVVIISIMN